jgi:hypothetical protein
VKTAKRSTALQGSETARKLGVVVLEVLSGVKTPTEASAAAEVSLPRYYALETRALQGLVGALEPRAKGRQRSVASELVALQKEKMRLERELGRSRALVRATQRTMGIVSKPLPKGRRRRRPTVRALKVVATLRSTADGETAKEG